MDGTESSKDDCKYGFGKMMFQVSGISVLSDEIARWLTDKQVSHLCVCMFVGDQ